MISINFFIRGVLHDLELTQDQITEELVQKIRQRFDAETLRPQKEDIINIYNSLALTAEPVTGHEPVVETPAAPVDAPVPENPVAETTAAPATEAAAETPVAEAEAAAPAAETTAAAPVTELPQNPAETPLTPPPAPKPNTATPPKKEPAPAVKTMHLPNAKEKEFYSITVDWNKLGLPNIGEHRIEGLEALGLSYDKELGIIDGTPVKAGDYELKLFFRYKGDGTGKPEMPRTISLFINHDPRSLWTEHEPEAGEPYWKEHTDKKLITNGQKIMLAASKRGRSHAKDAKFREDHFDIQYNELNGWHFMTVSDGAGSAKFSRQGSKLACETVIEYLNSEPVKALIAQSEPLIAACSQHPDDAAYRKPVGDFLYQTLCASVVKAYSAIEQEAQTSGAPVKDFSATLLVSMCKKFDFGWFVGGIWIGDGGIGIYNLNGEPVLLGSPDSGEYSGQTRFITMSDVRTAEGLYGRLRFRIVPDFDALVLMTDGITDAWFHTDHNLTRKEKWDELFAEMGKTVTLGRNNPDIDTQLLNWLDFWVKGEYDDRTIAIMF